MRVQMITKTASAEINWFAHFALRGPLFPFHYLRVRTIPRDGLCYRISSL